MKVRMVRCLIVVIVSGAAQPLMSFAAERSGAADAAGVVEVPVGQLVPGKIDTGPEFQLAPMATILNSRALYTMKSDSSSEVIVGTRELLGRLDEIAAVSTLRAMKKTTVYTDTLKKAGTAPVNFGKNLVTEPVNTMKNVGRGVGGFFSDIGYSITGGDPDQENIAKTAVGFGAARRALAFELGVNPYTRFKPLDDELNEVAWTSVGGNLTISVGFRAVGGTPSTVLGLSKTANGMRKLVRDNSPRKLKNINADKLKAMGVSDSLAEALLENHNYDPEAETRLVGALESLDDIAGRERFISRAVTVDNRSNGLMLRDWAELIAAYHEQVKPVTAIVMAHNAPQIVLADGSANGLYPTDYVADNGELRADVKAVVEDLQRQGFALGSIWVTGGADKTISAMVEELGWREFRSGVESQLFTE